MNRIHGKRLLAIMAAALGVFTGPVFAQYAQWQYSTNIVINTSSTGYAVTQNVTNFPFFVRLDSSNFTFGQAKSGGADLRFSKSDGVTALSYEIEKWDSAKAVAAVWVLVDTVRGNNATQSIKMYWGNPAAASASSGTAVFTTANGFGGVWHLKDVPAGSGSIKDATSRNISLTPQGTMSAANLVAGVIGDGLSFDGTTSLSSVSNVNIGLSANPAFTITGWWRPSSFRMDGAVFSYGSAGANRVISINDGSGYVFDVHYGNDHVFYNAPLVAQKWYHVAITCNPSTGTDSCFVNGTFKESWTHSALALVSPDLINVGGASWNGTRIGQSILDEVTVSTVQRSSAWIKLAYQNQHIPVPAAPVIAYSFSHMKILTNSFIDPPLTPAITGSFDSLTITPILPSYFTFDPVTGGISGWTTLTNVTDSQFIVRAYNEKGIGVDTLWFSFLADTSATGTLAHAGAVPFISTVRLSSTALVYSIGAGEKITSTRFSLNDCSGRIIWQKEINGASLRGPQTIPLTRKLRSGVYFLEIKPEGIKGNTTLVKKTIKQMIVK